MTAAELDAMYKKRDEADVFLLPWHSEDDFGRRNSLGRDPQKNFEAFSLNQMTSKNGEAG